MLLTEIIMERHIRNIKLELIFEAADLVINKDIIS